MKIIKDMNNEEIEEYLIELNVINQTSELANVERILQYEELIRQCDETIASLKR